MAGRKPKGFELEQKLRTYLETYELDDLNRANDLSSLRQLAQFEIIIENMQAELSSIKSAGVDTKRVKDLSTAIRDAVNSYNALQVSLGIDRKKRSSESEESVVSYLDKLKSQAKKFWSARLKTLKCVDCHLPLMRYYVYVGERGEPGSINAEIKPPEQLKYNFEVECPKCGKMVSTNERESNT